MMNRGASSSGIFSPMEGALDTGTLPPASQSPPAMISLTASGFRRHDSHPARVDSTFYLSTDDYDHIREEYSYRASAPRVEAPTSGRGRAPAAGRTTGTSPATGPRATDKAEGSTRRQQLGPYYMLHGTDADESNSANQYNFFPDMGESLVQYGGASTSTGYGGGNSSFTRPSSQAPTLAPITGANGNSSANTNDAPYTFLCASSPVATTAPPSNRLAPVESVGIPQAMQPNARRTQSQQTPKAATAAPATTATAPPPTAPALGAAVTLTASPSQRRRNSSGATPSAAGPGGIRLDSILISSSQIATNVVSPSRDNVPKRGSRFVGCAEDDIPYSGSFAKGTSTSSVSAGGTAGAGGVSSNASSPGGGGTGPGFGAASGTGSGYLSNPVSPSAAGQRKKVSLSVENAALTSTGRSFDSMASSVEATAPAVPKANRSLRVNLAHKALIGKGSYGMVFQAMDRDTNRIIAVKEIALNNVGSGGSARNASLNGNTADAGKRSAGNNNNNNNEDTVVGSTNGGANAKNAAGVSSSKNSNSTQGHSSSLSKSPTKSEFRRRLDAVRKELAVLKQLDHPNIVKCLGEDCDENYLRIYMEYVAGGSVTSVIRVFGNLQESQAAIFTRQMLDGLTYLHSKGIVHHDLKGDNLLVDTNGTLKLADFGTARDMQAQTHTNSIAGTAYFMAPEVISGEGSDAKSDIWSVGCCVIEMLTGKPPLPHLTNQYSIMLFITESKGELVDQYIPKGNQWSPQVIDFLRKCLARNPAKRPTAQQLLSHPWITSSSNNNRHSPDTTALTSRAVGELPSPPPVDRLRGSDYYSEGSQHTFFGGTASSTAGTDLECLTPTSELSKKHRKEKKVKREKEKKKNGGGNKPRKITDPYSMSPCSEDDALSPEFCCASNKPSNHFSDGDTSPMLGQTLLSARWLTREVKRNQQQQQQQQQQLLSPQSGKGSSVETDFLPDIRAHSSTTTSMRSPFLPSLSGDRTPMSAHGVMRSSSSFPRGVFTEAGSSRRVKSSVVPCAPPSGRGNSGYDVLSTKASSYMTKSPPDSKDAETPLKSSRRDQSADDVVLGKDDGLHHQSNNRMLGIASPAQSQRKQKAPASPRMPPLPSPTARKK